MRAGQPLQPSTRRIFQAGRASPGGRAAPATLCQRPSTLIQVHEVSANTPLGTKYPAFREVYFGDTAKPRLAIGIGVNWNSPFGPFRIDFAKVLLKAEGDDTKKFTFNVGTQF